MDSLPGTAAAKIAGNLLDERDLAALATTCGFWRDILAADDTPLWRELLQSRFGEAPAAAPASAGAQTAPAARFRQLASLRQPVARAERVVWLNGQYLEVIADPSSTFRQAVQLNSVCWLDVGVRFPGVLPGRYYAAWRCRLQRHFFLEELRLTARQQRPQQDGGGGGAEQAAHAAEGEPAEQPEYLQPSVGHISNQQLNEVAAQVGPGWFELLGPPFEVAQPCGVFTELQNFSGVWKYGLVLDSVRLRRMPPAHEAGAAGPEAVGQPAAVRWAPA
ncbi:hypothetical protein ABPG75_010334 [Micractinium tetrahymenae]